MYPQRSVMTCGLATALDPPHFNHAPVRGATPAPDLRIRGRVVSIHAPAWGATANPRLRHTGRQVSIHAPAWGATLFLGQSFARRGVSIHAPAWGATRDRRTTGNATKSFNPRTRVGCDLLLTDMLEFGLEVSIHAPAWGATVALLITPVILSSFNPRTRVGCDFIRRYFPSSIREFQSTHPRGVRQS